MRRASTHWIEEAADMVAREFGDRKLLVGNGGLSVSGLQHVGRLRGEVTMVDVVMSILEDRGYEVKHTLVLYTLDPWKGKRDQLAQFSDVEEAKSYVGWPLYKVPDPYGCHDSWVEHYWEDFGPYLGEFARRIDVVPTHELYKRERMREFVKRVIVERRRVIEVLNKYRKRMPYTSSWIPFEPICKECGRVDSTETRSVDLGRETVSYVCNSCGYEGTASLEEGKLKWRLEWVGVWYSLDVSFEPYGKDHATPGGSRDSCNDLALNVFGIKPPVGLPYEWVGLATDGRDLGDMGSSDFLGFTPREWLEVAEPEVLRYLYLSRDPMKRVVLSLQRIPQYTDQFDQAERVYYGLEEPKMEPEILERMKKSYYYSLLEPPPPEPPFQLPYSHAVILVQILPERGEILEEALERLRKTGYLGRELRDHELRKLERRLELARTWLAKYAPPRYRIRLLEEFDERMAERVDRRALRPLRELLIKLRSAEWTEESIKRSMMSVKKEGELEKEFFRALYLAFFGEPSGPRIAPYLAMLDKNWVLERLERLVRAMEEAG